MLDLCKNDDQLAVGVLLNIVLRPAGAKYVPTLKNKIFSNTLTSFFAQVVLGHEMAHSVIGHTAEQLTRSSFIQVMFSMFTNIPHIRHFFYTGKISENKIYTEKRVHKRCQLSNYYTEKYQFCVHSGKIYTGQKKFTPTPPVVPVTNIRYEIN